MKIALYTSGEKYMPLEDLNFWLMLMEQHSIECYFNCDFALNIENRVKRNIKSYCSTEDLPSGVEIVISYGGDGTFLKCVNMFFDTGIPILGVNSGRLGFLANVPKAEITTLIDDLVNGNYSIEHRPMLYCEELGEHALNEFGIQKKGLSMVELNVRINAENVAQYMADGVLVCTPTGSTAYSMSLGGAIIAPQCECMMITPIAPHNLNMRPLIVSSCSKIEISAVSRTNDILATLDNREFECGESTSVTIVKSTKNATFIKLHNISFYKTLREKLMWGMDQRQK